MGKLVSIAIIGGGASGTLTALHLLRKLNVPARICLFEKRQKALYRGNAYSSPLLYEPLNVPAGRMSVFNHLPDDFYYWLKNKRQAAADIEITKDSFVSRRWYGDYITERISNAAEQASHINFQIVTDEVTDVNFDTTQDAYAVLSGGNIQLFNYLVFATGNEPPAEVFKPEETAGLNGHYIRNPWITDPFKGIIGSEDLLIIGTGLTMVDHVVSLHKRGHTGKIFCFSRNGYLPLPHTDAHQNFVFEFNSQPKQLHDVFSEVRKNVAVAGRKNIQWQNTLDAMRGKTSRIWKLMSLDARQMFLKRLRSFWEIHRHRMPPLSAETLSALVEAGQLQLLSGRSAGVESTNGKVVFRYLPKGSKEAHSITVHRVINCTGPSGDYLKSDNSLLKNMLNKGWMKQDDLKIGIVTGVRGEIIQNNGVVLQNAFSIGPLRKATEWESTAIREIRMQAEETAAYISSRIELNHEVMVEIGI